MSLYTYEEVIEGSIEDTLSDWKSDYKISEDLPALAEIITEEILKALKEHNYKIMRINKGYPGINC